MPTSIMTLNVEGRRHLERVTEAVHRLSPDILCLQEILEDDFLVLKGTLGYTGIYAASAFVTGEPGTNGPKSWGVAILSRFPIPVHKSFCYSEDSLVRILVEPNDPRRFLLVATIEADVDRIIVATTHFTWSPLGKISDTQVADFARLKMVLASYDEYVLCGDFNAPRGREMFGKFIKELALVDNVPEHITSTIDEELHRAGALNIVVDSIFSTSGLCVENLSIVGGLSDHKAILGEVRLPH